MKKLVNVDALARHFDFPGGLAWGPSYHNTQHQIVCRDEPKAKRLEDLAGKRIGVIEESVADRIARARSA